MPQGIEEVKQPFHEKATQSPPHERENLWLIYTQDFDGLGLCKANF
jgi:hypothetical protein